MNERTLRPLIYILASALSTLMFTTLPLNSARAACKCAGTTATCTGAHVVLHSMFVPETVEINLDDMGLMRTKFVNQGGIGSGQYTSYWCTCNSAPACHYHTTSSDQPEDGGRQYEWGGCQFLTFPPSLSSCETDTC